VIAISIIGLAVILGTIVLRTRGARGGRTGALTLAIAGTPLFLTIAVPAPFALVAQDPTGWARRTVLGVSRVGISLSLILIVIGTALTFRALLGGDRRAGVVFALETVLAGLPFGVVAAYAALALLL
jgi:hypothetical protein